MTGPSVRALHRGLAQLGTEGAFRVLARARALEAAGLTGYCPAAGLPELRAAAAAQLSATRGIAVDRDAVLVAPGAKPFLFFTVLATCAAGDEVVLPDPAFPIYASAV